MVHHAYKGGLIEHVVAVTQKVQAILELEGKINRGIALAGAILHDIGKVLELDATGQGRTPEGRLIGHVILGVNLIRSVAGEQGVADASWMT
jgi:3'-5' exoribonuclease